MERSTLLRRTLAPKTYTWNVAKFGLGDLKFTFSLNFSKRVWKILYWPLKVD